MYLFCYGSNINKEHLSKYVKNINSKYKGNYILKDYELVFNHFFMFGNIEKKQNSYVNGVIYNINEDDLTNIKKKEFMYKLIDINVLGNDNKYYKCKTFKSLVGTFELFVFPYYKKLIEDGYKQYNIDSIEIKNYNYYNIKLIINLLGSIFGIYLNKFTEFKKIGLLLFFVDFSMVLDQIFSKNIYNILFIKYPKLCFILFKIIPTFIIAPYLIVNSYNNILLRIISLIFIIVDIITLLRYYNLNLKNKKKI